MYCCTFQKHIRSVWCGVENTEEMKRKKIADWLHIMLRASNDKYHVYVSIVHTQSLNLHFNETRILMLHNINDIPNIKHHSVYLHCTECVYSVDGKKLRGKKRELKHSTRRRLHLRGKMDKFFMYSVCVYRTADGEYCINIILYDLIYDS